MLESKQKTSNGIWWKLFELLIFLQKLHLARFEGFAFGLVSEHKTVNQH
jgi:hypothetical protein